MIYLARLADRGQTQYDLWCTLPPFCSIERALRSLPSPRWLA